MKKKMTALFLCLIMLVTVCVPGTLATSIDNQATESGFPVDVTTPPETSAQDETKPSAETTVPSETEDTEETETADETAPSDEDAPSEETAPSVEPTVPVEPTEDTEQPSEDQEQPDEPLTEEPATFSKLPDDDKDIILAMIYQKEGLWNIMMFADPAAQADEPIDKDWFAIVKDGQNAGNSTQNIPTGEITAADVPDLTGDGYTFAGAFYNGIPVLRVGQVEFNGRNYVYYITENSENDLVALVLNDDEQIELRYKQNPVSIIYTVTGGQTQADGSITVSGIPYGQTAQGTVTVIPADNPDTVFPGDDYAFTVEIPRGYHATVTVNGTSIKPDLGVMPSYQMQVDGSGNRVGNGTIIQTNKDAEYLTRYTYTTQSNGGDQNIVITLTKENTHTFSADLVSYTAYFGGSYSRNNGTHGNRATVNAWTGSIANGTYTWELTTTTTGANWEMDALQMNGTDLRIPFVNGKTETTVLPSGTTVSISRKYPKTIFGTDDTKRFVYTITLSNCYEDVVVTGGNLRATNHSEYIPYEFTGVESFQYKTGANSWADGHISQPISADSINGQHTFRFKLLPGYGTPTLTLKRSNEEQTVQQSVTPTLGADGYYTVNFSTNGLSYPALIVIEAKTVDIGVKYLPGTVSNAQVPVDNNQYSLSGKKEVLIPLAVPADPDGKMVFTGWENGGKIYGPNTLVPLEELQANGSAISFTAQWKDVENAEQITYAIQIKDEDGNILESTTSQAPSDTALILDVNSPTIEEWLKQHPEYEVDTENTTFYYESIKNGDVVELIVKEKEATITYVAVGPDGETGFGSVAPESEVIKVKSGTAQGSDAEAGTNFRFMGWFDNADCTGDPISEDLHYTPSKSGNLWEDAKYYAKFDYALADLTITKSGWDTIDENQSFVFHVRGTDANTAGIDMTVVVHGSTPVIIKDLPVGSYTVSEEVEWSWRYNGGASQSVTLTAGQMTTAPFSNSRNKNLKWLNGCAWCDNRWINGSANKTN